MASERASASGPVPANLSIVGASRVPNTKGSSTAWHDPISPRLAGLAGLSAEAGELEEALSLYERASAGGGEQLAAGLAAAQLEVSLGRAGDEP